MIEGLETLRRLVHVYGTRDEKAAFVELDKVLADGSIDRAHRRAAYVKEHAPTILAGLLSDPHIEADDRTRVLAIEQAGLLFDETEVP